MQHFDDDELQRFKQTIYENIMKGMMTLIDAQHKLGVPLSSDNNSDNAVFIRRFDTNIRLDEPVFLQYVPSLMAMWQDAGIQKVFCRRREFRLVRFMYCNFNFFNCINTLGCWIFGYRCNIVRHGLCYRNVCLSVYLYVCYIPDPCLNGSRY